MLGNTQFGLAPLQSSSALARGTLSAINDVMTLASTLYANKGRSGYSLYAETTFAQGFLFKLSTQKRFVLPSTRQQTTI